MGKKWNPYLSGDTIEDAGVHVLQFLTKGKRTDQTIYRVRCLKCRETLLMTHHTINQRRKNHRKSCAMCRQNQGVKKGIRPQYLTDPEVIPPSWPVPPMLINRPREWN